MNKNLFEFISEDFYKPLNSKYKRIYADCIQLIYEFSKEGFVHGMSKDYIVNEIERYIDDYNGEVNIDDEDDDLQVNKNSREQANKMITQLKKCGWLTYETTNSHEIFLVVNEYALAQMNEFERWTKKNDIEYEGLISPMYATVVNERFYNQPYQLVIKPLKENIERLHVELKRLGASMKTDMEEALRGKSDSEAISQFCAYKESPTWKSYQRLKTSDNMYFYKSNIITKLRNINEGVEIMKIATQEFMLIEGEKDEREANEKLKVIIWEIIEGVNQLEDVMNKLDNRHTTYLRSMKLRAQFLMKTGNNIEGKITQVLQGIRECVKYENSLLEEKFLKILSNNMNVYPQCYVTGESLQVPRGEKVEKVVDELKSRTVFTTEEQEYALAALKNKNKNKVDIKRINRDIEVLLIDKEEIHVDELVLTKKNDLIWMVYAMIYQDKLNANYSIRETENQVTRNGYIVPEFHIERKGKNRC